jgi:hypothetical protein
MKLPPKTLMNVVACVNYPCLRGYHFNRHVIVAGKDSLAIMLAYPLALEEIQDRACP